MCRAVTSQTLDVAAQGRWAAGRGHSAIASDVSWLVAIAMEIPVLVDVLGGRWGPVAPELPYTAASESTTDSFSEAWPALHTHEHTGQWVILLTLQNIQIWFQVSTQWSPGRYGVL